MPYRELVSAPFFHDFSILYVSLESISQLIDALLIHAFANSAQSVFDVYHEDKLVSYCYSINTH